jgi:hypothetical protein
MENRSSYSFELIEALKAAAMFHNDFSTETEKVRSATFIKAAVCLRSWYRHEALTQKPELILEHTKDVFRLYGGVRIERQPNGELIVFARDKEQSLRHIELSKVGRYLAHMTRTLIRADYCLLATQLVQSQGFSTQDVEKLVTTLNAVDEYVGSTFNVNWWRIRCTIADDTRVLGRLLWDSGLIDREVFSLATRLEGFAFSMETYNLCVIHKEGLAARAKEAPNMVPWLLTQLPGQLYGRSHAINVQQTVWKDLKDHFLSLGGTPQAWKWLCGQGYSWFKSYQLEAYYIQLFNALGALQLGKVPLHRGLVGGLKSRLSPGYGVVDPSRYLDVFKAAAVAHRKRKLKVGDFENYNLIFDYLNQVPTATTKGATWASLMRKQHVWHREEARREMERRKEAGGCVAWSALVQWFQQGDLEAFSLNNSDDLWEEGAAMVHCVGGYDERCFHNQSRIYSVRRKGERVATLELRFDDRQWTIGQLYGPGNTVVKDKAVVQMAKKVLAAGKRAKKLDRADNKVIREPKRPAQPQYEVPNQQYQPVDPTSVGSFFAYTRA